MRRYLPYLTGAVLGILALAAVPLSGLPSHRAGDGPGLTGWYGWLADRQSVSLRSLGTVAPDLSDPARVLRAAGHYELVCATCHGSPAAPPERFAQDLTPRPPLLTEATARWRPDARVFQTLTHGLRHTAMPAWPTEHRPDEVWDMVAFLRAMPDMTADSYRAMAGTGSCADCHGAEGAGRDGIPRLDIQSPAYITAALTAFRDGSRHSGAMMAAARTLDDTQIAALSDRFGMGHDVAVPDDAPAATAEAGIAADLALRGAPARDIPPCLSCHLDGDRATYPALLGQDARYLERQLLLFAEEDPQRGGPQAHVMAPIAHALTADEIAALADWLSGAGG